MAKINFYIRVPNRQLVSTKKLKSLTPFIPSQEKLDTHVFTQREIMRKVNTYKPKPYYVKVTKEEFEAITKEIKSKCPIYNSNEIDLIFRSITLIKIIHE